PGTAEDQRELALEYGRIDIDRPVNAAVADEVVGLGEALVPSHGAAPWALAGAGSPARASIANDRAHRSPPVGGAGGARFGRFQENSCPPQDMGPVLTHNSNAGTLGNVALSRSLAANAASRSQAAEGVYT